MTATPQELERAARAWATFWNATDDAKTGHYLYTADRTDPMPFSELGNQAEPFSDQDPGEQALWVDVIRAADTKEAT